MSTQLIVAMHIDDKITPFIFTFRLEQVHTHTHTRSKVDNWNQLVCVLKDHIVSIFQAFNAIPIRFHYAQFEKQFYFNYCCGTISVCAFVMIFSGSWSPSYSTTWPNTPQKLKNRKHFFRTHWQCFDLKMPNMEMQT